MLKVLRKKLSQRLGFMKPHDSRGRRLVVVIECLLNQNARDAGAAAFPAICWPIVRLCHEYNIGMLQMPCPEKSFLGIERKRKPDQSIREVLDTCQGRAWCREMSVILVDSIQDYLNHGYHVVAILGGNPKSPGCAVNLNSGTLSPDSGVFIKELAGELDKRSIHIPFRGIRDYDPDMLAQDIEWVRKIFASL